MEVDIEDFLVGDGVVEDITIVLIEEGGSGFDDYGMSVEPKMFIETNAYVSSRNTISLGSTSGGSFVVKDSFEFYIPTEIYAPLRDKFRFGGFIYYKGSKYQINNPVLEFHGASRTVIDCGYIGLSDMEVMPS